MVMVFVPVGQFEMEGYVDGAFDVMPAHTIYVDAFWIDQTEVTNEMFARFIKTTDYVTDAEKARFFLLNIVVACFIVPNHKMYLSLKKMVRKTWIVFLATATVFIIQAASKDDITRVREATERFHRTPAARAAGYDLILGLDDCFQNYGVGGRGYYYINTNLLDTTVDLLQPEAIVYASDTNGSIELGAVGYMVPAAAWDSEYIKPPQVLGQRFHLNARLGMYVLHAWIWKNNPSGMFEDWNPDVSCPNPLNWDVPFRGR
jgi:hypothetical protein